MLIMALPTSCFKFSILTFNMHGFNQGETFLVETCGSLLYDVICVQEHWLSTDNISKLAGISEDYIVFGQSAMSAETASGVLYGRPYGGVAIFLKRTHLMLAKSVLINDRVAAISVGNFLCVNVYLPCDDGSTNSYDLLLEILAEINNLFTEKKYEAIVIAGDYNTNLTSTRRNAVAINRLLSDLNVSCLQPTANNLADFYTFSNDKRHCHSIIDYICISSQLADCVHSYATVDNYSNFSDHEPLQLLLSVPVSHVCYNTVSHGFFSASSVSSNQRSNAINDRNYNIRYLRFDHGNRQAYYDYTRVSLQPIASELEHARLTEDYASNVTPAKIDDWYKRTVSALNKASSYCIPRTKVNALKFYWDAYLDDLKRKAMVSHNLWKDAGKPRAGSVFDSRTRDKVAYKSVIAQRKHDAKISVSNDLHDSLMYKKPSDFWKTWKRKVCGSKPTAPCIDGGLDNKAIADKFKTYFQSICTVNSSEQDRRMKEQFRIKLVQANANPRCSDNLYIEQLNAELIGLAIANLHTGKAQGEDLLQAEHLMYSHPILYVILARLFFFMLCSGHVPAAFGEGILIPIPKDSVMRGSSRVDEFRGITISPVISKVFEHCLLIIYRDYLYSSERQFGFKKNIGCAHAIFSVRKAVDHFIDNDSTVNICCLDIAKAFDRVNHYCLFNKLIDRGTPLCLILVLQDWYSKSFCKVKWCNELSSSFQLLAGVRQGGVLSPILFSVYIDNVLEKLNMHGCKLSMLNLGSFLYADDLILLAPSVSELQTMVSICCEEFGKIDLALNVNKSACIRIGKRCYEKCEPITTAQGNIAWCDKVTYLGMDIVSATKFTCCFDRLKAKFYSSFNSIYSKLGKINDIIVTLNLVSTIALPCLLFAIETLSLSKTVLRTIEHPWSRVFMKLFNTFDTNIVLQCQYYTNFLPVEHLARLRKIKFVTALQHHPCYLLQALHCYVANQELRSIAKMYNVSVPDLCTMDAKKTIYAYFESCIVTNT